MPVVAFSWHSLNTFPIETLDSPCPLYCPSPEGGVKVVNGIGADSDSDSKRVEGVFPVGYGLAREHLAVARRDARPVRRLPEVEPYDDSGLLSGAMVVSSNRWVDWRPFLRHLHYLAVAPGPGSFLSVVRSGERPRWRHPLGGRGAGHMAIQGCRSGGPLGPGQTVGHAPNARHRSSSMAYLRL